MMFNRSLTGPLNQIIVILIGLLVIGCSNHKSESVLSPQADKGILDLRAWDFQRHGTVQLKGSWEFYKNQHLDPDQLKEDKWTAKKQFISVPGSWKSLVNDEDDQIGIATYRLTVLLDDRHDQLALKITEVGLAYRLYLNGKILKIG